MRLTAPYPGNKAQNRHRTIFCTNIPKSLETTGIAGRGEMTRGPSTAPGLSSCYSFSPLPVLLSGDFFNLAFVGPNSAFGACCGSFPHPGEKTASQALTGQRNSVLFRRKRRVLRTRGFLSDQAIGLVLHTGQNRRGLGSCCWVQKSRCLGLPGSGLVVA